MHLIILIISTNFIVLNQCQEVAVQPVQPVPQDPEHRPASQGSEEAAVDPALAANQTAVPQPGAVPVQSNAAAAAAWPGYYGAHRVSYRLPYHARQYQWYGQMVSANQAAAAAAAAATAACQNQGNTARDVEERSNFEPWYLQQRDQDLMFLVCDTLIPAHRILLEASGESMANFITEQTAGKPNEPIKITKLSDLVPNFPKDVTCENEKFLEAFKIFLKYFYAGRNAFSTIEDLETSMMVLSLARHYIPHNDAEMIEPKAIESMTAQDLTRVYRFIKQNELETMKSKWYKYITDNAEKLTESIQEKLPLTCEEVENDVELLDQFLNGLNTTQQRVIEIIDLYLNKCPPTIKNVIKDATSFPNSIFFFRCTVDDLKSLLNLGFINQENLSEELEHRLVAQKRFCDELKKTSTTYYSHLRQMEPFIGIRR